MAEVTPVALANRSCDMSVFAIYFCQFDSSINKAAVDREREKRIGGVCKGVLVEPNKRERYKTGLKSICDQGVLRLLGHREGLCVFASRSKTRGSSSPY